MLAASLQKTPNSNKFSGYNIKPSDDEAPTLELWGMYSFTDITLGSTLTQSGNTC